jgi:hypothetical protein
VRLFPFSFHSIPIHTSSPKISDIQPSNRFPYPQAQSTDNTQPLTQGIPRGAPTSEHGGPPPDLRPAGRTLSGSGDGHRKHERESTPPTPRPEERKGKSPLRHHAKHPQQKRHASQQVAAVFPGFP